MQRDNLDVILHNMERKPEDWHVDNFRARHMGGVSIWLGGGILGYHIEKPEYQELGLRGRFRLHKHIKTLRERKP
ncbi:MAG: hypothetical protein QGF03_11090 [SAR324 cluster bacterium]|mgnify:FL=1|jgi:hypothetical protein|nr:hypothetical protein [SAR324 cluster bacterium]MDP7317535.1 hypothetical protein [SAR324 cluster bacterium]MDP7631099.1 hypothetical protein [SAR324 cluster bacterium]|tara:strand:- start:379 stop:603 length:225 start_codon:yes stop_codon:yes gene_type:complete